MNEIRTGEVSANSHTWLCGNCGDAPHVNIDGRLHCWICGADNGSVQAAMEPEEPTEGEA